MGVHLSQCLNRQNFFDTKEDPIIEPSPLKIISKKQSNTQDYHAEQVLEKLNNLQINKDELNPQNNSQQNFIDHKVQENHLIHKKQQQIVEDVKGLTKGNTQLQNKNKNGLFNNRKTQKFNESIKSKQININRDNLQVQQSQLKSLQIFISSTSNQKSEIRQSSKPIQSGKVENIYNINSSNIKNQTSKTIFRQNSNSYGQNVSNSIQELQYKPKLQQKAQTKPIKSQENMKFITNINILQSKPQLQQKRQYMIQNINNKQKFIININVLQSKPKQINKTVLIQ